MSLKIIKKSQIFFFKCIKEILGQVNLISLSIKSVKQFHLYYQTKLAQPAYHSSLIRQIIKAYSIVNLICNFKNGGLLQITFTVPLFPIGRTTRVFVFTSPLTSYHHFGLVCLTLQRINIMSSLNIILFRHVQCLFYRVNHAIKETVITTFIIFKKTRVNVGRFPGI